MYDDADQPILYIFAISHYCEKARWALDYLEIDHRVEYLPPGTHAQVATELGAQASSLPILAVGKTIIQGSDAIFDWANATADGTDKSLELDAALSEEGRLIEQRLDSRAGVQTRRYFYSEALVEHPETVLPVFAKHLAPEARATLESIWEFVAKAMIERMDLGREQWDDARGIVERELDFVDGLLADGRSYLLGDHFSRVDITAASLLGLFAEPPEHPISADIIRPPRVAADVESWKERPSMRWVREMYRSNRKPLSTP